MHIAQLNIATLVAPLDSPELKGFVDLLVEINDLADNSPGFVWRLQDENGDATAIRPFGPDVIVNLTVWESIEALYAYTYRTDHLGVLQRRREWFRRSGRPHLVLWWVDEGARPTVAEAARRLALLAESGPTRDAFTFRNQFPATLAA
ncbi:DUF3291 domain-containing protein [Virgisporangium aurantiacum]|uniref:DUF3291 domain-containing protein n=1 Tax=Virgisporangium aurantiacum TaxID=175570 RepID=A0A8J3YWK7_9ACTN|nr:DUF3291 domain-containing protein [Virgisporangium aurantiacum]GIJ52921.1 hypothetical protein Vau01_004370 [Virgisporangium aurantiacum]